MSFVLEGVSKIWHALFGLFHQAIRSFARASMYYLFLKIGFVTLIFEQTFVSVLFF